MATDSRVVYHRNTENVGMPANLNNGIKLATGTFIANLHDGDIYDATLLEKWTRALERHPSAAFVFNQYRALDSKGNELTIYQENLPPVCRGRHLLEGVFFKRWRFDCPVWGTVMARRSAYLDANLFDGRFSFVSDVDMWMRLAEKHDVAYIQEPLIALPSRDAVPRQWALREDAIVRTMFWEARMRHYRDSVIRRAIEATRHCAFVAASILYRALCAVKHSVIYSHRN